MQPGGHRLRIDVCQLGSPDMLSQSGDRCDPGDRRKHAGVKCGRDGTGEGSPQDKVWAKERFNGEHARFQGPVSLIRVLSRVDRALQPFLWTPSTMEQLRSMVNTSIATSLDLVFVWAC